MRSQERGPDHVLDSGPHTAPRRWEIAGVFTPDRAQSGLNQVACRDSSQAHAIAFCKAIPMRAVFRRNVAGPFRWRN